MSENDALQHNPCLTEEGIGKCKPNYVFKNNVQLTSDTDEFKKELEKIVKADFQTHRHSCEIFVEIFDEIKFENQS